MKKPEHQSSGFRRMQKRMGEDAAEKMRQDTVTQQKAAREEVNLNKQVEGIKAGRIKAGPKILTDIMNRREK